MIFFSYGMTIDFFLAIHIQDIAKMLNFYLPTWKKPMVRAPRHGPRAIVVFPDT